MSSRTARTTPATVSRRVRPGRGGPAVIAAATLWGTTGTAARYAPAGVDPALVGSAGLVLGGLLLAVTSGPGTLALWLSADRRGRLLTAGGALAVAAYPLSFYPAVQRAGIALGTVVMLGCAPMFAGLLTLLVERVHPGGRWFAATLTCILGCTVLVLGTGGTAVADPLGVGLAALAGLAYATYSTLATRLIRRGAESRPVLGAMFGGAAVLLLPLQATAGVEWLTQPRGAAVVGWLALVTTFAAYLLYGYGLRTTSAATATTLALAEPAVATVLGVWVVGERLPVAAWIGLAVLVLGLVALAVGPRRHSSTAR